MHFCLMMTLTTIHLNLLDSGSVPLRRFQHKKRDESLFNNALIQPRIIPSFQHPRLIIFFRLCKKLKNPFNRRFDFYNKKKVAKYGIPIPFILFAGHFMANYTCKSIKFPRFHTVVYCCHLLVELGMMYAYFGWYQKQLVNLTDATELDEIGGDGDGQNERTFNF